MSNKNTGVVLKVMLKHCEFHISWNYKCKNKWQMKGRRNIKYSAWYTHIQKWKEREKLRYWNVANFFTFNNTPSSLWYTRIYQKSCQSGYFTNLSTDRVRGQLLTIDSDINNVIRRTIGKFVGNSRARGQMGRVDFAAWRNNDVWITCRLYLLYDNIIHNGQLRFFFFLDALVEFLPRFLWIKSW